MPLYEYRCDDCKGITSLLVYSYSVDKQPSCEHCDSANVQRLISRFSFRPSWGDSLNWVPSRETTSDLDESSGASVDKYMGRIKKEMGGQTTPEFNRERREIKDT
ncbi:MAG: zinc ribbon domain-containing protein [Chloroflexi bacterium]|nr:zinc ribbon domain-containing protein [Chloroflexota bacterium]